MEATGRSFAEVLAEAQALGYAEADPTMDIGGFDAGHKITILAALAFGCAPTRWRPAEIEGVDSIDLLDLRLAKDLGYRIKLVATAARSPAGVSVRVHPAPDPHDHPLARVDGVLNALFIQGARTGRIFIQGAGAGAGARRRGRGGRHRRRHGQARPRVRSFSGRPLRWCPPRPCLRPRRPAAPMFG